MGYFEEITNMYPKRILQVFYPTHANMVTASNLKYLDFIIFY